MPYLYVKGKDVHGVFIFLPHHHLLKLVIGKGICNLSAAVNQKVLVVLVSHAIHDLKDGSNLGF